MGSKGCLFVGLLVVCLGNGVLGQVASLCRPNERFLSCGGCHKTCRDPAPVCTAVCREGCYCEDGEVRNDTGHCVELSECPSIASTYLHTSEPRTSDTECPENEEYRFCEPCNRTCDNPNPICPAQCVRGCFCMDTLVRDRDGRCVKLEHCSDLKNEISNQYQLTCGPHQTYRQCQECERTCSSPRPVCHSPCNAGCFCDEGYLKSPSGKCVTLENCPRAEISLGAPGPSIEDCQPDEVYVVCGWCEPSCSAPRPVCPPVCTRACVCAPPLLRHRTGHCVQETDCARRKCADPNEEYVCRYGCEARCDVIRCHERPRRCNLDCHCRLGLLRDAARKCVTPDKCLTADEDAEANKTLALTNNINARNTFNKVNESESNLESSTDKSVIEVRTYVELPTKILTEPVNRTQMEVVKVIPNKSNIEVEGAKNFRDVISMARRFYKEFASTPLYREVDIRVPKSFKTIDLAIPELKDAVTEGYFKEGETVKKDGEDMSRKEIPVEVNTDVGGTLTPFKEPNLNSYVNDILMAMKDMLPEPMNFTIVNYPLW